MSSISTIGNMIHLNQNSPAFATKYANYVGRMNFQDVLNSDMFEANSKRLKETRDPEANEEISEHLYDSEVYQVYRKKSRNNNQNRDNKKDKEGNSNDIIDDKNHKIDIKV